MSKKLHETLTESTFGDDSDESYLPCESRKISKTKVLNKKKSCVNAIKEEQKDSEDSSCSNKTVNNLKENSEESKSDNSDEPLGFNVTIRPVSESKLYSVSKGTAHEMDFIKTKQNCIVFDTLETTSQSSSVGGYLSMNPSDEEYHPGKSNRKKKFNKRKTCSIKKRKK